MDHNLPLCRFYFSFEDNRWILLYLSGSPCVHIACCEDWYPEGKREIIESCLCFAEIRIIVFQVEIYKWR